MNKYDIAVVENATNVCNINPETPLEKVVADCMTDYLKMRKAEEQGLLIKLPCKVGDEFWVIAYKSKVVTHVKCSGYAIQEDIPNGVKNRYVWLDSVENPRDYWKLDFEDFKAQCFRTKEEAKQALKQMGE